jgi:adenylosuccinate synthase
MANAGHTAVNENGEPFIAKALPSSAVLNKWREGYKPTVFVGASSAFDLQQLLKEWKECDKPFTLIHQRAGVITQEQKERESGASGTKHVASTLQGCGAFLADKVMRKADLKLARDYEELQQFMAIKEAHTWLKAQLESYGTILHEGSQGFSLDISHGSHYPECTSRSTTAIQNLADLGLNHKQVGDVYVVFRPYPIRVGNVYENGVEVGNSGGCYGDNQETTWEAIADAAGAPPEIKAKELTTVTKRLRRVFTFSMQQITEAAAANGASYLALNFANYIDWTCYGTNDKAKLSSKIWDFIHSVQEQTGVKVGLVGTGPQINHVIDLR